MSRSCPCDPTKVLARKGAKSVIISLIQKFKIIKNVMNFTEKELVFQSCKEIKI